MLDVLLTSIIACRICVCVFRSRSALAPHNTIRYVLMGSIASSQLCKLSIWTWCVCVGCECINLINSMLYCIEIWKCIWMKCVMELDLKAWSVKRQNMGYHPRSQSNGSHLGNERFDGELARRKNWNTPGEWPGFPRIPSKVFLKSFRGFTGKAAINQLLNFMTNLSRVWQFYRGQQ